MISGKFFRSISSARFGDRIENGKSGNGMGTKRELSATRALRGFGILLWLTAALASDLTNHPSATLSTNHPASLARGPGITYKHDDVTEVPWSIHLVQVDRSRADLKFE